MGTVSRVLNRHANVGFALKQRVEAAILELDFRPNVRAQSFSRDSSPVLSFVVGNRDLLHPFHSRILRGVSEECERQGYFVIYSMFRYDPGTPAAQLQLPSVLRTHGIAECIILAGTNYPNLVECLEQYDIKYVLLANNYVSQRPREPFDQVCFDEIRAAYGATQYLIDLGHRDIWYIGDTAQPWDRNRYKGFAAAVQEAGLPLNAQTVGLADGHFANGLRNTDIILDQKRPMTAIFAATDEVAFGAVEALRQRSLNVPDDISVVGFDDQPHPFYSLELTTVRVEAEEIGRQLARMAIARVQSPSQVLREVIVPTKLMKRGTCRPTLQQRSQGEEVKNNADRS